MSTLKDLFSDYYAIYEYLPKIESDKRLEKEDDFKFEYLINTLKNRPIFYPTSEREEIIADRKSELKKSDKPNTTVNSDNDSNTEVNSNESKTFTSYKTDFGFSTMSDNERLFYQYLNQVIPENSPDSWMRGYLKDIAKLESDFDPAAYNKRSKALGWFQFLPSNISAYGSDILTFRSNPTMQIQFAQRMLKDIRTELDNYESEIKKSGLTPLQVLYGMWWRPKSMRNYLKTGKDDYVDADGNTLQNILNKANGESSS